MLINYRARVTHFFGNIVLNGDNTKIEECMERLQKESNQKVDMLPYEVNIDEPEDTENSTLASVTSFDEMWMTQDEYSECKPSLLHLIFLLP